MQGRHSPTCVLPRNCTNSLLQQGPGILPISPAQKWVNKSMPVAKSSDWWLLLLPQTHVLSSSCPQDHEHSLKKDRLQTPIFLLITLCLSCWFQTLGLKKFVSRARPACWQKEDSPAPSSPPHKYAPLPASKTFIFITWSLSLHRIVSRGDGEEEEGEEHDTENILQKSPPFILKF